jgi:hypothetical protein
VLAPARAATFGTCWRARQGSVVLSGACRRAREGAAAGYRGEQVRAAAAAVFLSRSGRGQRRRARQRGMEGSGAEQAGPAWFPPGHLSLPKF